jgi:hypothetical protein
METPCSVNAYGRYLKCSPCFKLPNSQGIKIRCGICLHPDFLRQFLPSCANLPISPLKPQSTGASLV